MQIIQVGKLKKEFSTILDKIRKEGEKYVVAYGKSNEKVAIIIPYDQAYEKVEQREFGLYKNKGNYRIHDDFEMTEEELFNT